MIGQTISHYRITAKLGAGGMGEVYLAEDTKLERQVALKFLPSSLSNDPESRRRFLQEARAAAALDHPNICPVHEIGEVGKQLFIAMAYLTGDTLASLLCGYPLELNRALFIAEQIALGLAESHAHGIIHRDVKPANIIVGKNDHVRITDFGLAKLESGPALTQSDTTPGTLAYMSPEQVLGERIDARTDIWSLGVILYEMLTQQHPFAGDNPAAILYSIMQSTPPSLCGLDKSQSAEIGQIIDRCLAKKPQERYANAKGLALELRRVRDASGQSAISAGIAPAISTGLTRRSFTQDIRFCTTPDGIKIAYSIVGEGPILVRVLGWFTHLEIEWEISAFRRLWEGLAQHYTVIRYDGRGIGLSDPYDGEYDDKVRTTDLDTVLNAARIEQCALLGISEGGWTAAAYAHKNPERINKLILYGTYARGKSARPGYDQEEDNAILTLMQKGWGTESPRFRQIFTSEFFPPDTDPDPSLLADFDRLQRASAKPETAASYDRSSHRRGDGTVFMSEISVPTLVLHLRDDRVVPFEEGRYLASVIPDAKFVPITGSSHYFPTDDRETTKVIETISSFLDRQAS